MENHYFEKIECVRGRERQRVSEMRNENKKHRSGSIVKREVETAIFFILHSFAGFVVVVVFTGILLFITRKIIILPSIFPWNMKHYSLSVCVFMLRVCARVCLFFY